MSAAPLQSGINRSNSGFNGRLASDAAQIERSIVNGSVHIMPGGAATVVRADHPPFDGLIDNGPYLRIGLCVGSPTRLAQQVGNSRLEGLWRPGTLAITPPNCAGFGSCGKVAMIGLAIAPGTAPLVGHFDPDRLNMLARQFHDDALLAAVLNTLYHEADVHGSSTAFFEHGVALVMRRLGELGDRPSLKQEGYPLPQRRFDRVLAYVGGRLGDDISVIDLAAVAGMDPSGFSRAMRARTGLAPYAWLTQLRMERATQLLDCGLSVTEIANDLGYENAGKFAAAFRRVKNCAPSKWLQK
ncbi:AraC family transcriptional regulator [Rhizobium sp. PP-CC-2G-626]|nr:AraC family transcriptional regulator [Rhizobium sp. PP-CC-2G-626]